MTFVPIRNWTPEVGELVEVCIHGWRLAPMPDFGWIWISKHRWVLAHLLYLGGPGDDPDRPYTVKLRGRCSFFAVRDVAPEDIRPVEAITMLAQVASRQSVWGRLWRWLCG